MRYALGERLIELKAENETDIPSVFLITSSEAKEAMLQAQMVYEGVLRLDFVN